MASVKYNFFVVCVEQSDRFLKCPFTLPKIFDQKMIKIFGGVKGHFKNRYEVR
jgi:hypothetical protein